MDNLEKWSTIGIVDDGAGISSLLVNETARSVIAVFDVGVSDTMRVKRLYHRRFNTYPYIRVEPIAAYESQEDAQCATAAPFVFFLSRSWERPEKETRFTWFSAGADLWRTDLRTGQRELALKEQDLKVSLPNIRVMLQGFHAVRADGSGGIVTLGLEAGPGKSPGTTVDYGLFSVDFGTGEAAKLTSLPHTFL
jgi:hypothetical protein